MRYINTNEKITIPAQQIPLSEIEIKLVSDTGTDVTLSYFHPSFDTVKTITLWNEEEYAVIGNWTDANVDARMIELKNSLM
jgi:hypothetical protein